jgi:hypothetical protein
MNSDTSYDILKQALSHISVPHFYKVNYSFKKGPENINIPEELARTINSIKCLDRLKSGETAAITASSRGIIRLDEVLSALVKALKARGVRPFIFPAMGSHGGATAEGQREVLKNYGITEETMDCPVKSSMETVHIGDTAGGIPVHIDKYAFEADHIIPVGRIKPHTDFHGKVESGLLKMLTIGVGKQFGASMSHQRGWDLMADTVFEVGRYIIKNRSVPFGLGIIEDALHKLVMVEAIRGEEISKREQELLLQAKSYIPRIPFKKVDILIVDEIGKNISGAGMDPNVTGRSSVQGKSEPFIDRIAVLSLSAQSKHNASGANNADVITKRLFDDIDFPSHYINALTSHDPNAARLPMHVPSDKAAIQYTIESLLAERRQECYRMVWIKNTAALDSFYISPALRDEALQIPGISVSEESREALFDGNGDFEQWSGGFSFRF